MKSFIILSVLLTVTICNGQNLLPLLQSPPITVSIPNILVPGDIRFTINATVIQYIKSGFHASTAIELKNAQYPFQLYAGYRSVEAQDPVDKDTIYRLASMSKMATSLTVMQYVENDYIDLHDEVSDYIEAFDDTTVLQKVNATPYELSTIETVAGSKDIIVSLPYLSPSEINKLYKKCAGIRLTSTLNGVDVNGIFKIVSFSPFGDIVTVELSTDANVTGIFNVSGSFDVLPKLPRNWSPYDYVNVPSNRSSPFQTSRVYYSEEPSEPVTIRHLLAHTAGFAYPTPVVTADLISLQTAIIRKRDPSLVRFSVNPSLNMDVVEWTERMSKIPMLFQPGTSWVYGPQVGMAGAVLLQYERDVAGGESNITLYQIQKRILFDKLNITDAGYFILDDDPRYLYKRSNLAHVYTNVDTALLGVPTIVNPRVSAFTNLQDAILPGLQAALIDGANPTNETNNPLHPIYGSLTPRRLEFGDAGLYMRTDELQRIVTTISQNGVYNGQQIVQQETIQEMLKNQIGDLFVIQSIAPNKNVKWGYGVAVGDQSLSPAPLDKTSAHWAGAFGGWWYSDRPSNTSFASNTNVLPLVGYQPLINLIANATNV